MKLGYNTNGLAFHRWEQGIELLAEIGYEAVAITVDHHCLDPYGPRLAEELDRMRRLLERHRLRSVIETGARFLLNPRVKHEPTLLSATPDERQVRLDFLKRCIDIAAALGSEAVSFWSGILRDPIDEATAMQRLTQGCRDVLEYADRHQMRLAFEPEPGMFIETFEQYRRLTQLVDGPLFGLTIDIGHVQCVEEGPIPEHLHRWRERLFNVHLEDMRRGVHDHLRFGAGEIDFPPVIRALQDIGYTGCGNVELSRHSHIAPEVMRESFEFLSRLRGHRG